jgi:hypothetical protein
MRDRCCRSVPGSYVVEDRSGHPGVLPLQRVSRGDDPRRKPPADSGDASELARGRPVEVQARPCGTRVFPGGPVYRRNLLIAARGDTARTRLSQALNGRHARHPARLRLQSFRDRRVARSPPLDREATEQSPRQEGDDDHLAWTIGQALG